MNNSYQKGTIIITALLLLSIAASIALLLQTRVKSLSTYSNAVIQFDQRELLLQYANAWARKVLNEQSVLTKQAMPAYYQNGMQLHAWLIDMQGLVNINNLAGEDFINDFIAFVSHMTSSDEAQELKPSLLKLHKKMKNNDTFILPHDLLTQGFIPASLYQKLSPFLVALSPNTKININTAKPEVLWLLDAMNSSKEKIITQMQNTQPLKTQQELTHFNLENQLGLPLDKISIRSDWFILKSKIVFGKNEYTEYQLLKLEMKEEVMHIEKIWKTNFLDLTLD